MTGRRGLAIAASAGLVLGLTGTTGPAVARANTEEIDVSRVYEALTPRERVGQLFLVAFSTHDDDDPIADALMLVSDYGVGGLVLQKGNQVFYNVRGKPLPATVAAMTTELQQASLGDGGSGVPLFIAVDHEGDGDPTTHLREGFTAVPSAMAIGAAWDPSYARAIGAVVGNELAAVGVNLLLGPSLDVLAMPRVDSRGDIGTRSFGGDPYWVSEMGRAYIRGVHEGSHGKVATTAKHFPGHGGSDRLPDDEVATVNKSLAELRRVELPPFAAVTAPDTSRQSRNGRSTEERAPDGPGEAPATPQGAVTDALMTSHIRYRGFQGGNIRRGTKPISIDPEALDAILSLGGFPFAEWRSGGGLIVADSLGVRAIRRYDDPTGETFRHRAIARQALEAGNDLLILAQFAATPAWSSQLANVQDTIDYFADQYSADLEFRSRVDEASLRVLRRKAALYPEWSASVVAAEDASLVGQVGSAQSREIVATISQAAVTRLRGDEHPLPGQRIVLVTDDEGRLECVNESCGLSPERRRALDGLGRNLVDGLLLERYGPSGTSIFSTRDVSALQFCQIDRALAPAAVEPPQASPSPAPGRGPIVPPSESCPSVPDAAQTIQLLQKADWVVFAFADLAPQEVRDVTGRFLPQIGGLLQPTGARIAVLSFGPPYYIDATNFALLDTFVASYSKIPASIDAALEVWMGDRVPTGAPPVSILDADYDLTRQLEPDPNRPLPLEASVVDEPTGILDSALGLEHDRQLPASVHVVVGPVLDYNGNPVPDDTEVQLSAEPEGSLDPGPSVTARTVGGMAQAELRFPHGGSVAISARSGGAESDQPARLKLPTPTPLPRAASTSDPSSTVSDSTADDQFLSAADLLLALAAVALVSGAAATSRSWRRGAPDRQLRTVLLVACGGLAGYLVAGAAASVNLSRGLECCPFGLSATALTAAAALCGAVLGLLAALAGERRTRQADGARAGARDEP